MIIRKSLVLCFLLFCVGVVDGQLKVSQLVELTTPVTPALRAQLVQSGFDVQPSPVGRLRLILAPGEEKHLRLAYRVIAKGRPLAEAMGGSEALDPLYYSPAEIKTLLQNHEKNHPGLVKFYDLTTYTGAPQTHENRHIYAIKISDNVGVDENEPNVCLVGQHHAREVNSTIMVTETIAAILKGYPTDPVSKRMVDEFELWFVPMVNPDGTNHVFTKDNMWRKNRRDNGGGEYGVDPNRNYPFRWQGCGYSTQPSSGTYCGPTAGSEPCVKTIMALGNLRHFSRLLDFHSSGQEVLFPYSPCTTSIPTARKSLLTMVTSDLCKAANYQTRSPSASGEDQEWQMATRGTLAYLVEVMNEFQPTYANSVIEAKTRIWPLFKKFMDLPVPLSGQVQDLFGKPLAAEITVQGVSFNYGETITSGGAFGRYFVWLADGTYKITINAKGYAPLTITQAISATNPVKRNIVLGVEPARMTWMGGNGRIGTRATFLLSAPKDIGLPYFIGTALGTTPGQKVGTRIFPLNPDGLFMASLQLPTIFKGNLGWMNHWGMGRMDFDIPFLPGLIGQTFYIAGFTVDANYPHGIKSISNALPLKFK